MLAEASRDARLRAEKIAQNTGASLGGCSPRAMGVLQINPAFSTEFPPRATTDKIDRCDKDVLGVVTASFAVK
jgi:hypothetical protein